MVKVYQFYNRLLRMPIFYLYCMTLIIIIAIGGFWWHFLYSPLHNSTNALQFTINGMHLQLDEFHKTEKILNGVSQSIDTQNMHKKSAAKMRNLDAQQNLSLIADSAINAGITIESCKLCMQHEESWCFINDISANFKGSLDQIISFFDALKKSKQIFDVTQCTLVANGDNIFCLHALFKLYCT